MSSEFWVHVAEIVILGLPMWYGLVRLVVINREFPPHLHDDDAGIRYPRGMEPGAYRKRTGDLRREKRSDG